MLGEMKLECAQELDGAGSSGTLFVTKLSADVEFLDQRIGKRI